MRWCGRVVLTALLYILTHHTHASMSPTSIRGRVLRRDTTHSLRRPWAYPEYASLFLLKHNYIILLIIIKRKRGATSLSNKKKHSQYLSVYSQQAASNYWRYTVSYSITVVVSFCFFHGSGVTCLDLLLPLWEEVIYLLLHGMQEKLCLLRSRITKELSKPLSINSMSQATAFDSSRESTLII